MSKRDWHEFFGAVFVISGTFTLVFFVLAVFATCY